jgi:hypothetical protein
VKNIVEKQRNYCAEREDSVNGVRAPASERNRFLLNRLWTLKAALKIRVSVVHSISGYHEINNLILCLQNGAVKY